jgi:hypothetical protein
MDWLFSMFIGAFSFYMVLESYRKIDKPNVTVFLAICYVVASILFFIISVFAFLNVFG